MKNRTPLVSIVIPVKDQEKTIRKCIDSLLNLDYPEYEIIIVDNNSKDKSPTLVKRYKNRKIRLLFERKPGSYSARNKGIQIAKGEIIAFSDGDCVIDKNWLKFLVQPFKDKRVGGVGGKIDVYKPKNKFELYCSKFHHLNEMYIKEKNPFLLTANVAYKKKILEDINLFDGNLYSGGDVDVSWKVMKLGYRLYFEPKAIVSHIYEETPFKMFKKSFYRGKYRALINIRHKTPYEKENKRHITSLKQMIKKYPLNWIIYRTARDFSFHLGFFYGWIIFKYLNSNL